MGETYETVYLGKREFVVYFHGDTGRVYEVAAFQAREWLRRLRSRTAAERKERAAQHKAGLGATINWLARLQDRPLPALVAIEDEETGDIWTPGPDERPGVFGMPPAPQIDPGAARMVEGEAATAPHTTVERMAKMRFFMALEGQQPERFDVIPTAFVRKIGDRIVCDRPAPIAA